MTTRRKTRRKSPVRPKYLRPSEAAQLVGVHPDTLARWADGGKSKTLASAVIRHPNGHRRYRLDAIQAYVVESSS